MKNFLRIFGQEVRNVFIYRKRFRFQSGDRIEIVVEIEIVVFQLKGEDSTAGESQGKESFSFFQTLLCLLFVFVFPPVKAQKGKDDYYNACSQYASEEDKMHFISLCKRHIDNQAVFRQLIQWNMPTFQLFPVCHIELGCFDYRSALSFFAL